MTSGARRRTREAARRKGAAVKGTKAGPRRSEPRAGLAFPGPSVVAGAFCGLALAAAALAYDPSLFAPYYVPRRVLLYVLVAALPLLLAWDLRSSGGRPGVDLLDALALAFAVWQLVAAAASPAGALAWVGYYNRGTGALFWCALALLFLAARRLLRTRASQLVVAACLTGALVVSAVVAALQAASVSTWWGSAGVVGGRVTGTLGNPVHLAAFGLAGVWLAVVAAETVSGDRVWRAVLLAAGVAGAVCIVLSVSRAAYLGGLAAAVYLLVVWVRARRRALVVALCVVLAALAAGALVYAGGGSGGTVWSRLTAVVGQGDLGAGDVKRTGLWQEGLSAVAARPLTGYGPGAFVVADRLYADAADRIAHPWVFASDAHSLPLELAATGGLVALLLVVAGVAAGVWSSRLSAASARERGAPEDLPLAGLPARAYLLAALVYLLVSPLDLVVLAPVAIAAALLCPPRREGRFVWRLGKGDGAGAARAVTVALALAGVVLVAGAVWAGQRAWRADRAFTDTAKTESWQGAARASGLAPWEAFYALEAGARRWRGGLSAGDAAEIARGRAELQRGVAADPTAPDGYADLARLAIAQGGYDAAAAQARDGLLWDPHQPALQGLWAVAALNAQAKDPSQAASIAKGLEALPPDTPDAWYWLAAYRRAIGDSAGAVKATSEASRLAPELTKHRYKQRLLRAR